MPRAIAAMAREHPGVEVALGEASTPALLRRLRAGRIEVAVVALDTAGLRDAADLRVEHLLTGRSLVAVADAHLLAPRGTVVPEDLEGETWIVGAAKEGEPVFGPWPGLRDPPVAFAAREWASRLGLVAAGLGIATVPAVASAVVPAGVTLLEVSGGNPGGRDGYVATAAVRSPAAAAFVRALETAARTVEER